MSSPALSSAGPRLWRAVAIAGGASVVAALVAVGGTRAGATPSASTTTAAARMCGVADPAAITAGPKPSGRGSVLATRPGANVSALATDGQHLTVLDFGARRVDTYFLGTSVTTSFTVPWRIGPESMAVAKDGSVYLARYPTTLVKLSAVGVEQWAADTGGEIDGVFVLSDDRVGAIRRGQPGSLLFDPSGRPLGGSAMTGTAWSRTSGGMVGTDVVYVRQYRPDATLVLAFGDPRTAGDPTPTAGPFHFYQQGGAALGPDGTIYVADATRGIHGFSPAGELLGTAPEDAVGVLTQRSWLVPVGDRLYYGTGGRYNNNQSISSISFADLASLVRAPKAPNYVLGVGAGLATSAPGNYFPAGTNPAVWATLDWSYGARAASLRLSYTVRSGLDVQSAAPAPAATVASLPTSAAALAHVPLTLPRLSPGAYEVDARLYDGARLVGATCLPFTVGAPGQRLGFNALPGQADYGGPAPARAVAIADQLGTGGVRIGVDWSRLLPNPAGAMNFSAYDAPIADAVREAASRGVRLWVQVGKDDPAAKALVASGQWERRVGELVRHYARTVNAWEAWNEPNNNFGDARSYLSKVLAPFARAVRSNAPGATVIGGSTLGVAVDYWRDLIAAGGLASLDAAAIHPYTGHNRSWEEQGTAGSIRALRGLLDSSGGAARRIWITELAWWGDGPANRYATGDRLARAMLWSRALGIEETYYFLPEGGWGPYEFSYSLIQAVNGVDYVKPSALAAMTAAAAIRGRPFVAIDDASIPGAYAARFGGSRTDGRAVLATWTDDLRVDGLLTVDGAPGPTTVSVTDVDGATSDVVVPAGGTRLHLSGSPLYVYAPPGVRLHLGPTESYGPSLAAASAGARASASSSLGSDPPAGAIDGNTGYLDRGDLPGLPVWASAPGDDKPVLTVELPSTATLDRIVVTTHSNASIVAGLRDYIVAVRRPDGRWVDVGKVTGQFYDRRVQVQFAPTPAKAIRVLVTSVNYSGSAGGAAPWYWPTDAPTLRDAKAPWYGPAVIAELQAYAPGAAMAAGGGEGGSASRPATVEGGGTTPRAHDHGQQSMVGLRGRSRAVAGERHRPSGGFNGWSVLVALLALVLLSCVSVATKMVWSRTGRGG